MCDAVNMQRCDMIFKQAWNWWQCLFGRHVALDTGWDCYINDHFVTELRGSIDIVLLVDCGAALPPQSTSSTQTRAAPAPNAHWKHCTARLLYRLGLNWFIHRVNEILAWSRIRGKLSFFMNVQNIAHACHLNHLLVKSVEFNRRILCGEAACMPSQRRVFLEDFWCLELWSVALSLQTSGVISSSVAWLLQWWIIVLLESAITEHVHRFLEDTIAHVTPDTRATTVQAVSWQSMKRSDYSRVDWKKTIFVQPKSTSIEPFRLRGWSAENFNQWPIGRTFGMHSVMQRPT